MSRVWKSVRYALPLMALGGTLVLGRPATASPTAAVTLIYPLNDSDGAGPRALVAGPDGNLYGATRRPNNGTAGYGTLFRVTPDGAYSTIHTFEYTHLETNSDGIDPQGPLALGTDGNLYGACSMGGPNKTGTIFKSTLDGSFAVLYTFSAADGSGNNVDGARPMALTFGPDGALYGCTRYGGANHTGVIFRITTGGAFNVLHTFGSISGTFAGFPTNPDGMNCLSSLVSATDGNLYGVASSGGATASGTAFRISTAGAFTLLHTFAKGKMNTQGPNTDGAFPVGIMQATDGTFVISAVYGGKNKQGTIDRMTSAGAVTVLHTFTNVDIVGENADGANPSGAVMQAADGNFYSTTTYGGESAGGTLFRLTPAGAFSSLAQFQISSPTLSPSGSFPLGPLVELSNGYLYGVAEEGGVNADGGILRISIPRITGFGPSTSRAGVAPFTLTVYGSGFQPGAVVTWVKTNLATTYVSPSEVQAKLTATQLTKAGVFTITVTNPDGGSNTSTYTLTNPVPILTSITPGSAPAGSGDVTITLKGKYFIKTSVVLWNGSPLATTYVGGSSLTAVIPAAYLTTPGTATISVFNPAPGGGTSTGKTFTIQ